MLAGLAPDGGLYVPAAWPRLDAGTIASFAGRPYAEVAVEVIRPFVGGAIPECDLARMRRWRRAESARPSWSRLPETPAEPRSRPFAVACARTCSCFFRRAAFPMCSGG